MYLSKYIKEFENSFSLKTLSVLIRFISSRNSFVKAAVGTEGVIYEKVRKVSRHPISPITSESLTECHWANFLNFKITNLMNLYLEENQFLNYVKINHINQCDLLKYELTDFYDFHVDQAPKLDRTLSAVIFLNNDYEGGELCFKNLDDENERLYVKPQPGKVVIWPSNFLFPHSVQPVKNGIRYTIVLWA